MVDSSISYVIALILELSGIFLLAAGIVVELTMKADIWHLFISVGSLLITAGSIIWGKILRGERNLQLKD